MKFVYKFVAMSLLGLKKLMPIFIAVPTKLGVQAHF